MPPDRAHRPIALGQGYRLGPRTDMTERLLAISIGARTLPTRSVQLPALLARTDAAVYTDTPRQFAFLARLRSGSIGDSVDVRGGFLPELCKRAFG